MDAHASAIEATGSAGEVQGSARRTKRRVEITPSQADWLNSVPEPIPTQEQVDEWMKELPW